MQIELSARDVTGQAEAERRSRLRRTRIQFLAIGVIVASVVIWFAI